MKTTYKDLEGDRPQRTLCPWGHLDFKATENCLKQGTFAYVLLLSKPILTAYEQLLCILIVSQINLWRCPLSANFGYYDPGDGCHHCGVAGGWGMRAEEMHKP